MNKRFKYYAGVWAMLLVMFNVITFVLVEEFTGIADAEGSFWIGYIFVTLMLFGQLGVGYLAFRKEDMKKTFYSLSLVTVCWRGLIAMFIVGTVCMAISAVPSWLAIVGCLLVLGFSVIALIKASAAADLVDKVDEKIKVKTFFIKSLTVDAETLMASAKSDGVKVECKKVYEAIRYSDPMSSDMLASVEGQITVKFDALSKAVTADDAQAAAAITEEMLILIKDRNAKCKMFK